MLHIVTNNSLVVLLPSLGLSLSSPHELTYSWAVIVIALHAIQHFSRFEPYPLIMPLPLPISITSTLFPLPSFIPWSFLSPPQIPLPLQQMSPRFAIWSVFSRAFHFWNVWNSGNSDVSMSDYVEVYDNCSPHGEDFQVFTQLDNLGKNLNIP